MMKKTGLFGGTFNPIHIGHLIIAEYFREEVKLDEVIFLPASVSPFKSDKKDILPAEERLKLIEISIKNNPKFSVSDCEIKKGGISYTYQTVEHFRKEYPDNEIYWLIGGDQIIQFHKWKNYRYILDNVNLAVAVRPNTFKESDKRQIENNLKPGNKILWLNSPNIEISSSDIRERIRQNKSIKYLLLPECEQYIEQKKFQ